MGQLIRKGSRMVLLIVIGLKNENLPAFHLTLSIHQLFHSIGHFSICGSLKNWLPFPKLCALSSPFVHTSLFYLMSIACFLQDRRMDRKCFLRFYEAIPFNRDHSVCGEADCSVDMVCLGYTDFGQWCTRHYS